LDVVTLGLFQIVWMWATWSELKGELHDDSMHPVWHALSQFLPIGRYIVLRAHFRAIERVCAPRGVRSLRPALAVLPAGAAGICNRSNDPTLSLAAGALSLALSVVQVVGGQAALNSYWRTLRSEGRAVPMRARRLEWVAVGACALPFLLVALGSIATVLEAVTLPRGPTL
jgi:hypothetical protein